MRFGFTTLLLLCACHEPAPPEPARSTSPPAARPDAGSVGAEMHEAGADQAEVAALTAAWLEPLEQAAAPTDYACPPVGATSPRPVVIVLHGMDARPEWVCGDFHATFGPWPWVICPRGDVATAHNWSWGSTAGMKRAIVRVLARTQDHWPGFVADEGRVLVTYSLSASLAPALLAEPDGTRFASALFLEGFTKQLSWYAPAVAKNGLARAVFVATQPGNRAPADRSAQLLSRAGVPSVSRYAGSLGHWFQPKTVPALRLVVADVVGNLPGWGDYPGAPIE